MCCTCTSFKSHKTRGDAACEFGGIEIEHPRHEAERENIFALILGRAADGLHRGLRDGAADVAVFFQQLRVRLHVAAIVQNDATFF